MEHNNGNDDEKDVVVYGLIRITRLISIRHQNNNWSIVSPLFLFLLRYIADSRLKVRRQAHVSLRESMRGFQETSVLVPPASEAIAGTFEKFLLLAGGSNAANNNNQGSSKALEVLYVLDLLKDILPLMSLKFSTKILYYFKSLLALHQSVVTRRISDALYSLCFQQTVQVSPEALVDLLSSLAISVSSNGMSGDDLTFTARLLNVGMKKVFFLNRETVVKLPLVFSALKDTLASEHEEPLSVSMEALKSLIHTCIDEILIKEGVDQIMTTASGGVRKAGPTIIEKLCATVESLLDYSYAAVWEMSFQVVSALFDKLGELSSYYLKGALKSLEDIQKLSNEDFPYRKQLHDCIGVAVVVLGPETFLKYIPLNLEEAQDLSEANLWVFPILKQNIIGARLSFFNESLLDTVRVLKLKSAKHEQDGHIHSARSIDGLIYSLWSLLPSFCNYPLDTAETFKDLEISLCHFLQEEPDLPGVICTSLQILIRQNKKVIEGENERPSGKELGICEQRAFLHYSSEVAVCNLDVLRSSAREILSTLLGVFVKSSNDDGGSLKRTIGEFASIADKGVVFQFFRSIVVKLLKATQEARKVQNNKGSSSMEVDSSSNETSLSQMRAQALDLAISLLQGLGTTEVDALFEFLIRPALKDAESSIQKKAYKVLSTVLEHADGFTERKHKDLLELMFEVMLSCHFSAKRHRLDCLYFLVVHVSKEGSEKMKYEVVALFLTEIILGLKEANKKTRNRSYEIIVQIGHACVDEEKGGNKNLYNFFDMVAGGLAGETSHMISAAVKGIAHLACEFSDLISKAFNANIGLLKVLVAKSQAEGLQTHMRGMVEALLSLQGSNKNHFKAKVKQLLEMLVKKCGLDVVKDVMPDEHMKLLTNIRKTKERKEQKHASNTHATKSRLSKETTSRQSRWNHTNVFSDFSDEENDNGNSDDMDTKMFHGRHSSMPKTELSLFSCEHLHDEPLDLLDRQKTRLHLRSSRQNPKRKLESDEDEPEIDAADGRLIIREDETPTLKRDMQPDTVVMSSHLSSINSRKAEKRRKTTESGWAYMGSGYSSKKAGGDLKRKGKLEPYAYWPLDRKMVSHRPDHQAAAMKGMSSVVKLSRTLKGQSVSNASSIKGLKLKTGGIKQRNQKKLG